MAKKITVKTRLMMSVVITFVAMIMMLFFFNYSISSLQRLYLGLELNEHVENVILKLRKDEKDFITIKDKKYLGQFETKFIELEKSVDEFEIILDDVGIKTDELKILKKLLASYRDLFHQLVEIQEEIGLDSDSGLTGTLRASVHRVEEVLEIKKDLRLTNNLLMLRRYEKDFILRSDLKYLELFKTEIAKFKINLIRNRDLEQRENKKLSLLIESYKQDFLNLADGNRKKGLTYNKGILGELRKVSHESEEILEKLETKIHDALTQNISAKRANATVISVVFIIAFALFNSAVMLRSILVDWSRQSLIEIKKSKPKGRET